MFNEDGTTNVENVSLTAYAGQDNEVKFKYTGEMKNGKPHGKGKAEYKSNCYWEGKRVVVNDCWKEWVYIGDWVDGKKHGDGKLTIITNEKFGNHEKWIDHQGYKTTHYNNEITNFNEFSHFCKYVGKFENDIRCGYGEFFVWQYYIMEDIPDDWGDVRPFRAECMYKGMWKDDKPNGNGSVKRVILIEGEGHGEWWEGEMCNGLKTGPWTRTEHYPIR